MSDKLGAVILAAGKGTRLKLDIAKPLAPIMDERLVDFSLKTIFNFSSECNLNTQVGVVTGYQKEEVESYLSNKYDLKERGIEFALQKEQRGTADALRAYFEGIPSAEKTDYTLVMCADTPLIKGEDITKLFNVIKEKGLDGVAATFTALVPTGYGRISRANPGFQIIEEKDATDEQREITEVNSGVYILKTDFILKHLNTIDSNNKSGEFYLTDLFKGEYAVEPIHYDDAKTFLGVNTLKQLADCEKTLRIRNMINLRDQGVRFIDLSHSYVSTPNVGAGTTIYPNAIIDAHSVIGENVTIGPGAFIENTIVEDGAKIIAYSHLEDSIVKKKAKVGPFAHLRPGASIGEGAKVGNFVEIKKSTLKANVSVSHLSYVGDAEIGENTNIGCGFITCNYDGAEKHKTIIGKDSFIGSDTQMIAPINIGERCFVASGSTINNSMPDDAFAIARGKQMTKEGMAKRFIKTKS